MYALSQFRSWGLLFPADLCAASALIIYAAEREFLRGEWVPALIMAALGVPFIVAFILDRTRWWALIPAFVFAVVAAIPVLATSGLHGAYVGAFINIMIGLPFIVTYFAAPKAWWAIIPGGIMLSIGAMIALTQSSFGFNTGAFAVAIMFLGWALTFALLWWRHRAVGITWAKYPALGISLLACLMFLIALGLQTFWSLALIIAGGVLVAFSLRQQREHPVN
jgi:hypothetical protein